MQLINQSTIIPTISLGKDKTTLKIDNLIVETIIKIKKKKKKWLKYRYWKCRKTVKNSQCKCYKSSFLSKKKKKKKILDLHPPFMDITC